MYNTPHLLYPFLCQWKCRLLPCLGCCKHCCHEQQGACILSDRNFVWICAQEWNCRILFLVFKGTSVLFLEKAMAVHSRILAWRVPWMEEPGRLQSLGLKESDTTERPRVQAHRTALHSGCASSHWEASVLVTEASRASSLCVRTEPGGAGCEPRRGPNRNVIMPAPHLGPPSLQNHGPYVSTVYVGTQPGIFCYRSLNRLRHATQWFFCI